MSLFHPSPDVHHPSQSGEPISFSEAVLDSSRAHRVVPEKYHELLDELLENIHAFCREFKIPNEALKNVDTFGDFLRASAIPQDKMAEAVLFFQQLEHLVTHKEPLREILSTHLQEAERLYHLQEQYAVQVELIKALGILNVRGDIKGVDGKSYPLPTVEQIAERLCDPERKEFFATKREQKFTKLLLVPFGMSLDSLIDFFKYFLLDYQKQHPEFALDIEEPVWVGDSYQDADADYSRGLRYFPRYIDGVEHQGRTKLQILEEQKTDSTGSISGWHILLLQAPHNNEELGFRRIPRSLRGDTEGGVGWRDDVESCKTPEEYFSMLETAKTDSYDEYFGESGMTPEDWIMAFMTHLEETGEPLDNFSNRKDCAGYLACMNQGYLFAPRWNQKEPQVELNCYHRLGVSGALDDTGMRLVVEV